MLLVSDGIESCDADPCAASKELARAGIRFTSHVVGVEVTASWEGENIQPQDMPYTG